VHRITKASTCRGMVTTEGRKGGINYNWKGWRPFWYIIDKRREGRGVLSGRTYPCYGRGAEKHRKNKH